VYSSDHTHAIALRDAFKLIPEATCCSSRW